MVAGTGLTVCYFLRSFFAENIHRHRLLFQLCSKKKDPSVKITDESSMVAGTGLEPMTFGL